MKMNFFKAFFAACRGPVAFIELRRQAAWRVIGHLILTILLSSICIGIGRYCALKYFWAQAEQQFVEVFGNGISISKSGMLPEKDVDLSRRQELPYDGLLLYISPKGAEKYYPDETLEVRNFILVWTPGYAAIALRNRENGRWSFAASDAANGEVVTRMVQQNDTALKNNLTLEEMRKEILSLAALPLPENFKEVKESGFLPSQALFKMLRGSMAAVNGGAYFRLTFFMVVFGVVAYMMIFWLAEFFPGAEKKISSGEMWKIALYAACPVIVVVNCFPMLQLPFESWYEKIFLVAWLIYINVIKRWLERNGELIENQENNKNG